MEPYGLEAITAFERLAYLKTETVAGGQSSYARDGLNFDWIGFTPDQPPRRSELGYDQGYNTLLNLEGPGVVYRIWCTGFDYANAVITIFIDDKPTWWGPLRDLFSGDVAPFLAPLAGTCPSSNSNNPQNGGDGFYCYLPIPFQKSIKIVTQTSDDTSFYYNIGYHKFVPQTRIQSWTGKEDSSAAIALWGRVGQDPKPKSLGDLPGRSPDSRLVTGTVDMLPGQSSTLLDVDGPGSIGAIKLSMSLGPQLNDIWLHISWDGEASPSVNVPISMFFALGMMNGMSPSQTLAVGFDGDWFYCYFPMPFKQHARIGITNGTLTAIEEVNYEIHYTGFHDDFFKVGYFKAAFSQQSLDANTGPINFLEAKGAGHLVGVVESIQQRRFEEPPDGIPGFCLGGQYCMLEGDERVYVDDCRTPIIQGTGTEDFFNSAWYFGDGQAFKREMHGCTYIGTGQNGQGRVSAHRLFLQDAIPFRKNIRAVIEHGPNRNDVAVLAWTLAYYYYQPAPRAMLCDTLWVGDPPSESAHQYLAGPGWHGSRQYTFEGDEDRVVIEHSGRAHASQSSFVVKIPADNQGLILRRVLDYSIGDQKACVLAEGQFVGTWFTAGYNPPVHCWREDDFLIPKEFTHGKNEVQITIQFVSSKLDWNEFQYTVYSRHESDVLIPTPFRPTMRRKDADLQTGGSGHLPPLAGDLH